MMMTKRMLVVTFAAVLLPTAVSTAWAHFQEIIPLTEVVTADGPREIALDVRFTHPMENGPVMDMGAPKRFGVLLRGETRDLLPTLQLSPIEGKSAYKAAYTVRRPGDHVFFIEPAPYWEPGEQKMIIHYAKVVVNAMGMDEGWDTLVGLPVEIEPLTRPYGLWTGNVFQGVVLKDGKPAPFATVEVEYLNDAREVSAPADPFVTQVVKSDANGVFTYAMPRAGWWGFAALIDGDEPLSGPDGKPVDVELGGLIWVRTRDMK
jgi:cobalt/nickel transport protein